MLIICLKVVWEFICFAESFYDTQLICVWLVAQFSVKIIKKDEINCLRDFSEGINP